MIEEYKKYITEVSGMIEIDILFDDIIKLKNDGEITIQTSVLPTIEFDFICYESFCIMKNRKEMLNEL